MSGQCGSRSGEAARSSLGRGPWQCSFKQQGSWPQQNPGQQRPERPRENSLSPTPSTVSIPSACICSLRVSLLCSSPCTHHHLLLDSFQNVLPSWMELASSSLILQTLGPRHVINNCPHTPICTWKIFRTLHGFPYFLLQNFSCALSWPLLVLFFLKVLWKV